MRFCLLTCDEKPSLMEDDMLLKAALEKRGHAASSQIWSAPDGLWETFDACIIRSTWDYHRRLPEFLSWLRSTAKKTAVINAPETVSWNASKEYLLELEAQGLPIVPTAIFEGAADAEAAAKTLFNKDGIIIVKPAISAGAERTFKIRNAEEIPGAVASVLERGKVLLQPFVTSIATDGELSLLYFNIDAAPRFSHAVQKNPHQGDFKIQAYEAVLFEPAPSLVDLGRKALSSLKHPWTYARFDVVDWRDAPKIGEIELIEPLLFFKWAPASADLAVAAIEGAVKNQTYL